MLPLPGAQTATFARDADGSVRVLGRWPAIMVVTRALLEQAQRDGQVLRYHDGQYSWKVANASARYSVDEDGQRRLADAGQGTDHVALRLEWAQHPPDA